MASSFPKTCPPLSDCTEQCRSCRKAGLSPQQGNQIDSIGDELKQIGNSVSNVGRLLAGKGTKEVSDEKPGVGLTRAVNTPVKKAVENLRKKIDGADQAFEKLDRLSARLDAGKEAEKGGRVSVKDKLSQMKEKAGQQKKAPEPDKAKSKEECL